MADEAENGSNEAAATEAAEAQSPLAGPASGGGTATAIDRLPVGAGKRRRGRPRKNPVQNETPAAVIAAVATPTGGTDAPVEAAAPVVVEQPKVEYAPEWAFIKRNR